MTIQTLAISLLAVGIWAGVSFGASQALANGCDNLDDNKVWKSNIEKLNAAFDNRDWDTALEHVKKLQSICDNSPILNYTIAHVHKEMGDNAKYLYYLQKSTENTEQFVVDRDILDTIWSEKYIAEHPEADPKAIEKLRAENKSLKQAVTDAQQELESAKLNQSVSGSAYQQNCIDNTKKYATLMWSGVGVGVAGLILTTIGAVLVAQNKSESVKYKLNASGDRIQTAANGKYVAGWGLLSAGLAATVAGAAVAGIAGYYYDSSKKSQDISLAISPTDITLSIAF